MISSKRTAIVLIMALAFAVSAWAQHGRSGMGMGQQPPMPGLQNPVPGSGAQYQMTLKDKNMDVAYAIVGKEDVDGNPGFWVETRMQMAEMGGETVTKMLMVTSGPDAGLKRMITQQAGHPPMEMSGMLMKMMNRQPKPDESGKPDMGQLVGTESVTVPAGTYSCQHYRKQQANGTVDYWVSQQVTPYAMVKMTNGDMSLVLEKILTNETSHIKGEPQKFQMPQF